jgi:hypothetical protein
MSMNESKYKAPRSSRKRNFEKCEKEYLAKAYCENVDVLASKDCHSENNLRKRSTYEEIASQFNELFPSCPRTTDEIRMAIKNMKTEAQRAVAKANGNVSTNDDEWPTMILEVFRDEASPKKCAKTKAKQIKVLSTHLNRNAENGHAIAAFSKEDDEETVSDIESSNDVTNPEMLPSASMQNTFTSTSMHNPFASTSVHDKYSATRNESRKLADARRKLVELKIERARVEVRKLHAEAVAWRVTTDKMRAEKALLDVQLGNAQLKRELLKHELTKLGYDVDVQQQ